MIEKFTDHRRVQDVTFPEPVHLTRSEQPPLDPGSGQPIGITLGELEARAEDRRRGIIEGLCHRSELSAGS
ncbi:hypothetical protein NJB1507_02940 [Mycobacterium marinum]|nr:hypothetical protein NJB1507_02940 [Mycobacterium marinum]